MDVHVDVVAIFIIDTLGFNIETKSLIPNSASSSERSLFTFALIEHVAGWMWIELNMFWLENTKFVQIKVRA